MGFVARNDFSKGWCPDCDAVNAPPDALLRADNLILDERGVLALRQGAAKINASPLADIDVHSLFTAILSGTRYRMTGAGNSVYANGASIASGLAGSNDIAFGFHYGQILFARSTSKKKYDGSTVRNWGIAMTGALPTVTPIPPDGHALLVGAGDVEIIEGTAGTLIPNHYLPTDPLYLPTNGAIQFGLDPATNRAVYQWTFASPKDFTVYDAGTVGTDDDFITTWIHVSDPKQLEAFAMQFDIGDGRFLDDWYESPLVTGAMPGEEDTSKLGTAISRAVARSRAAPKTSATAGVRQEGTAISRAVDRARAGGPGSGGTVDLSSGWQKVSVRRGDFIRTGTTNGRNWSTVKAIRLVARAKRAGVIIAAEGPKIAGGAITGKAQWRYVYVRNASGYLAKSAMSAASIEGIFDGQAATITIPADASRDSQVNEVWLFRLDEDLDTYYRVGVKTSVSGTGGFTMTDMLRVDDVLAANIKIELDNTTPPDNIVAIVGPHFDRTLVLTSGGQLWPSKKLDPDAFATTQAINVTGTDETPLWMVKALSDIFIGTTKDIYRLEGTGAELPDGTVDYILRPMSMDHRPINTGIAHEGNQIAFFSDDGWRATEGQGTTLLTGLTSQLYRGKDRHGVSAVNVAAGRVRAVLAHGELIAITPEGSSTISSTVLYRLVFREGRWMRHVYAQGGAWRSVYREPDGTVLAGDTAGTVWQLDVGTQDAGQNIAVVLWTKVDDFDKPYQRKKVGEVAWRSDTGGANASITVHLNGSASVAATLTAAQTGMGVNAFDLGNVGGATTVAICKQLQFRLTGSLPSFHLYDYGVQFRERPIPLIARVVETHSGSPGVKILSGFVLKCNTLGVARVVTAYLDGVADSETFTITTGAEEPETLTLRFTLEGRRAIDIAIAVDGEIEIDSWSPIVTQRQPLGVKVWDSGPFMDGDKELVWLREILFKVRAGADLVITPYFDGQAFRTVTMEVTPDVDSVYRVPVGRSYVGRQPRIVVTSCEPFYPYWVRAVRRTSGSASEKQKVTAPFTLETGGS